MTTTTAGHSPRSIAAWLTALLMFLTLAACGGSGAGAGGGGDLLDTAPSRIVVSADNDELDSSGKTPVTITATVKDAGNRAVANQMVDFSADYDGVTVQGGTQRTDASGVARATVVADVPTAHTLRVTARSFGQGGLLSDSAELSIVGSKLAISGPSAIAFDTPTQFTVSVLNGANDRVGAGVAVTLSSLAGNEIANTTVQTNVDGQATFLVTGKVAGPDRLVASALGVDSSPQQIVVSGKQFEFVTPELDGSEFNVNQPHSVTVRLRENGANLAGRSISFHSTRGTIDATAVTDSNGEATVEIQSSRAGFATIQASEPDSTTARRTIEFVARTPAKLSLQANPSVIGVNAAGSRTNSSQVFAIVLDADDNPVKGATVSFKAVDDPSGGEIDPPSATTDSSGRATASFIAGPNPSGPGRVVIEASVGGALSDQTTLTAARQAFSVVIETGNTIEAPNATTYRMPWNARVTDTSGAPIVGAEIVPLLEPLGFRTGYWDPAAGGSGGWSQVIAASCASEDANRNGSLDPGEDINVPDVGRPNVLDPGSVASVTPGVGVTDELGETNFLVSYAKGYGGWTRVALWVTVKSNGTEGTASSSFWLPVLASDVQNVDIKPPGSTAPDSPFGTGTSCPPL